MNHLDHTHRVSISYWIGSLFVGSFLIFILVSTILFNFQDLVSGVLGPLIYLKLLFLIVLMLPLGILILVFPFSTKVIVNEKRLEYHTSTFILQADWQNLVIVGNPKAKISRKSLVVIPSEGTLVFKGWTKPFQKVF